MCIIFLYVFVHVLINCLLWPSSLVWVHFAAVHLNWHTIQAALLEEVEGEEIRYFSCVRNFAGKFIISAHSSSIPLARRQLCNKTLPFLTVSFIIPVKITNTHGTYTVIPLHQYPSSRLVGPTTGRDHCTHQAAYSSRHQPDWSLPIKSLLGWWQLLTAWYWWCHHVDNWPTVLQWRHRHCTKIPSKQSGSKEKKKSTP